MISTMLSRLVILVFGTMYPAYASYKAVRTKNVKEYVKWMMYWIVFALFTCVETFTDIFLSFWFPFYYEIKIILLLWLLSPVTKGSSILYRRFVHPALCRREAEIDETFARVTEQGYAAVLQLGSKGVNYATTVLMQTAIKNLPNVLASGALVNSLLDAASINSEDCKTSPPNSEITNRPIEVVLNETSRTTQRLFSNKVVIMEKDEPDNESRPRTNDDEDSKPLRYRVCEYNNISHQNLNDEDDLVFEPSYFNRDLEIAERSSNIRLCSGNSNENISKKKAKTIASRKPLTRAQARNSNQ